MPAEQENRFAEQRGAQRGNLARTASSLDERDQSRCRSASLLVGGPM
jgi:hypothetical protein